MKWHVTPLPPGMTLNSEGQQVPIPDFMWTGPHAGTAQWLRRAALAIGPPVLRAYKTDANGNNLVVFDIATQSVVKTIPVGKHPDGVAITPDQKLALVANQNSSSISVVDLGALSVTSTISLATGSQPTWIAVTPDNAFAYVANMAQGTVLVVDLAKRAAAGSISVGNIPQRLAVIPDGTQVWVANSRDNTVSIIDVLTNTVIKTLTVDTTPLAVAFDIHGRRAYVTANNTLHVIDVATYATIAKVPVGSYPINISVNPGNGEIWVANRLSTFISRINGSTYKLIQNLDVGFSPETMSFVPSF